MNKVIYVYIMIVEGVRVIVKTKVAPKDNNSHYDLLKRPMGG